MKTVNLISAFVVTFAFLGLLTVKSSHASEVDSVDNKSHTALAQEHEAMAKEAQARLEHHQAILDEYEDRSFYFGPQGLAEQSHAKANVREHEREMKEALEKAEHHRRMAAMEGDQKQNNANLQSNNELASMN